MKSCLKFLFSVTSTWNRAEWETEIHREAEELRNLEDEDDGDEEETQEGEQEENFNGQSTIEKQAWNPGRVDV